jgi:hypothetical protein
MGTTPAPEPRKHHYVPSCWLAGFTECGKADGRLFVTDFALQKQWLSTPENAAHIRDFYRLPDPAPDPLVVERFFSVLESHVARIFKSIDQERRGPNDDELDALLEFMAYQWVRVPWFRPFAFQILDRMTRETAAKMLQNRDTWLVALKDAGMDPNVPGAKYELMQRFFESGEWSIQAETDWYLQRAFTGAERALDWLRKRYWEISITEKGRFIASDNPVVLDGDKGKMVGFKNADVVLYPVSRHALLIGTLKRVSKPQETFNYFAGLNTVVLLRADRQVYSHAPDFSWLDENRRHQTDWQLFSKDRF